MRAARAKELIALPVLLHGQADDKIIFEVASVFTTEWDIRSTGERTVNRVLLGGGMRTRLLFVCLLAVAGTVANAATNVTGRWKVTITLGDQRLSGLSLLRQSGDKVAGSIGVDERNQHPLDGVVDGNRVTLAIHPRPGATAAFATAHLTVDGGKMRGTTEGGDLGGTATIELVRETP